MSSSAIELAVARATSADIEALKTAATLPNGKSLTIEELLAANLQFHSIIWQAARNERLVQMAWQTMEDLMRAMHTAMMSENTEQMVEQHLHMTDLIARKKSAEARDAMAEHVDTTRRRILGL